MRHGRSKLRREGERERARERNVGAVWWLSSTAMRLLRPRSVQGISATRPHGAEPFTPLFCWVAVEQLLYMVQVTRTASSEQHFWQCGYSLRTQSSIQAESYIQTQLLVDKRLNTSRKVQRLALVQNAHKTTHTTCTCHINQTYTRALCAKTHTHTRTHMFVRWSTGCKAQTQTSRACGQREGGRQRPRERRR